MLKFFFMIKQFKQINAHSIFKKTATGKRSLSNKASVTGPEHPTLVDKTLLQYLQQKIKIKGPLSVAEYMKEALGNPIWVRFLPFITSTISYVSNDFNSKGYYMKKDVFGNQGDFITSPEISQMFGEVCGRQ